jgi:hypothetical protein
LQLRQAEVQDLNAALTREQDVVRFQVTVDDPSLVGRRQSLSDLYGVTQGFTYLCAI